MTTIAFPDRDQKKRALAYLLGRFSYRVLRSGEQPVPTHALEAFANKNIRAQSMSMPHICTEWWSFEVTYPHCSALR